MIGRATVLRSFGRCVCLWARPPCPRWLPAAARLSSAEFLPEHAPSAPRALPPLRVSTLSPAALQKLLSTVGNSGKPLCPDDIQSIARRMATLPGFFTLDSVAAACHALRATPPSADNAGYMDSYVMVLADGLRATQDPPSLPQLVKYLSVLQVFSEHQSLACWERYLTALTAAASRLATDDRYFLSYRLTPRTASALLSPFQFVSALMDAEPFPGWEDLTPVLRRLLGSVTGMLRAHLSGRVSSASAGEQVAAAFAGLRGMSNAHEEVRAATTLLINLVHRAKPGSDLSGSQVAACLGALFNMSPAAENSADQPEGQGDGETTLERVLLVLAEKLSSASAVDLRLVGLAATSVIGLEPRHRRAAEAVVDALSAALRRHNGLPPEKRDPALSHFPLHSFACTVYCLGAVASPALEANLNQLYLQLALAFEGGRSADGVGDMASLSAGEAAAYDMFLGSPTDAACLAAYGLRGIAGNSAGARGVLAVLRGVLSDARPEVLSHDSLTFALCGLANMSSDCDEVLWLMRALSERSPPAEEGDCLSGGQTVLCLSSCGGKASDTAAMQALLTAIHRRMQRSDATGGLRMEDGDIALAYRGLENACADDTPAVNGIRRLLRAQLERNYKQQPGLSPSDAAVVMYSLHNASSDDDEVRQLLRVLAGRLEESPDGFTNEGAAMAMYGLQGMRNSCREVRYMLDTMEKKCFIDHVENRTIENKDLAMFLHGFRSLRPGHGDEAVLARLLGRAAEVAVAHRPILPMTEPEAMMCSAGIQELIGPDHNLAPGSAHSLDEEDEPQLEDALREVREAIVGRCT